MSSWVWKSFSELTSLELYEILRLRQAVFNVEQNCVYQDVDRKDFRSWHFFKWKGPDVVAYARVVEKGVSYPGEISIGRVVTAGSERKTGLGREMMKEVLSEIYKRLGPQPIRISAQQYLEKFYQSFGFLTQSEPYLEDNIPHVQMLRRV